MMKKIIATLLALALTVMPLALAEGADSDWYMAVLTDSEITGQYPYHCFADVNGDGVPVLIVSTTAEDFIGAEDFARVYIYDGGEARLAMEVGGAGGERFYCNSETHTLTHFYRFSGEGHIEVYEAGNGALTLVTKVDSYGPFHGPEGDNTESVHYQDDNAITEEESEALFEKYASDGDVLTYERTETADAWEDVTEEQLLEKSGVSFAVPEGAENVAYRWYEADGLAEMLFSLDADEYCARILPAALEAGEVMNISDIFLPWEHEEDVTIGHCPGTLGLSQTGSGEWVELCLWYDLAPGLMYSLSVYTTDPDGLDLTAVAEMVYDPMQGEA